MLERQLEGQIQGEPTDPLAGVWMTSMSPRFLSFKSSSASLYSMQPHISSQGRKLSVFPLMHDELVSASTQSEPLN